jgi:hypothetical protein
VTCIHLHINQENMSCRVSAEAYWDNSLKKVKISNFKFSKCWLFKFRNIDFFQFWNFDFLNLKIWIFKSKFWRFKKLKFRNLRSQNYEFTSVTPLFEGRLNAWAHWAVDRGPNGHRVHMLIFVCCDLLSINR